MGAKAAPLEEVKPVPHKTKRCKTVSFDKLVDFGRQLFASVLRSRKGSLSEMALLLRFKQGTKGFERCFKRLFPLMTALKEAYRQVVLKCLPCKGLRLGIFDDSSVKKTGKSFPKQKIHHDSVDGTFYSGMKVLSSAVYQSGKLATVTSEIVGEEDNKLEKAKDITDVLIDDFLVDILLFDSWYCKAPVIEKVIARKKLFISRSYRNSKVELEDDFSIRLDHLAKNLSHSQYEQIKVHGKSYWICETTLDFEKHGTLRVIISKDGQHKEPIFLVTNAEKFSAKFIVTLYLRRFSIEIFFKDAKQFLNFETLFCRKPEIWDLHLHLTNVLHWAIQKKKSISKTVRAIREDIQSCLLFINENPLIQKFLDELTELCRT